jgi:hypothetical protein
LNGFSAKFESKTFFGCKFISSFFLK